MKCYLDVDGTLLNKEGQPADCLHEFLIYVTSSYECYWLTTHVRDGTLGYLFPYLERAGVLPETIELMKKITPTTWDMLKTEAIDMTSDFLWFDDQPTAEELKSLERSGKSKNRIAIDRETGQGLCEWMLSSVN